MNTADTRTIDGLKAELQKTRAALQQAVAAAQRLQAERDKLRNIQVIKALFHIHYYDSRVWSNTFWLGHSAQKCPLDLWVYQEILFELRPTLIVECGTNRGGSALFLGSICELIGEGRIVTIDIKEYDHRPRHERITYLQGSSTAEEIVHQVEQAVRGEPRVMVILDSDHSEAHVARELEIYHRFVTPGSYLIVEDTNVNGHPVLPKHGPGPMEALARFLQTNQDFYVDTEREKFHLTFNPRGFLRRVS